MRIARLFMVGAATLLLCTPPVVYADSAEDLAKEAQNPVADLISLPLQNNANFKMGQKERTRNILNIQPVWPIQLNDDWNVITRTILPVKYVSI